MRSSLQLTLLALAPALTFAQTSTSTNQGNCTTFTLSQQPYYLRTFPDGSPFRAGPRRVSAAITCPANEGQGAAQRNETFCPIRAAGDAQIIGTYNVSDILPDTVYFTSDNQQVSYIWSTIKNAVQTSGGLDGQYWGEATIGAVDAIEGLQPGRSGYIQFTPYMRCFTGTFSDCTGGNITGAVLPVEVCAATVYKLRQDVVGNKSILAGEYDVVNVPAANVSSLTDPYTGQSVSAASFSLGDPRMSLVASFFGLAAAVFMVM